jgi:cold shock CspA family protein
MVGQGVRVVLQDGEDDVSKLGQSGVRRLFGGQKSTYDIESDRRSGKKSAENIKMPARL